MEKKKVPRRLELQPIMSMAQILDGLPKDGTVGCKKNAKGYTQKWTGYKQHVDVADAGVPISCLVSSDSLHNCQADVPLATVMQQRVTGCNDLMDSACDAKEIYTLQ